MKKITNLKKGLALVLAAVLAASGLAVSSVYAATAIDFDGTATLTVSLPASAYAELNTNDIDITLYKVADVDKTGDFKWLVNPFDDEITGISDKTTASQWRTMAENCMNRQEELAETFSKTATISGEDETAGNAVFTFAGTTDDGSEYGMYLMAVGALETDSFRYEFEPSLVAVPGNHYNRTDAAGNTVTDDAWVYELAATLKAGYGELYGDLEIHKHLTTFNRSLNSTSFVFQVTAYKDYSGIDAVMNTGAYTAADADGNLAKIPAKQVYNNVVSVDFSGAGDQIYRIEGIPAGAVVFVEEVYGGASYELKGAKTEHTQIVKNDSVAVFFENDYSDELTGNGTAVVNVYSGATDENNRTIWTWTSENALAGEEAAE